MPDINARATARLTTSRCQPRYQNHNHNENYGGNILDTIRLVNKKNRRGLSDLGNKNFTAGGDAGASTSTASAAAFETPLVPDPDFVVQRERNIAKQQEQLKLLRSLAAAIPGQGQDAGQGQDGDVAPAPTMSQRWKTVLIALAQKPTTERRKILNAQTKQTSIGCKCSYGRPGCDKVLNARCLRVETSFDGKHAHVQVCRACHKHWWKNGKSWPAPVAEPSAKQKAIGSVCTHGRPGCDKVLNARCVRVETSFDGKHVQVCSGCYHHWWKNGKSWEAPVAR